MELGSENDKNSKRNQLLSVQKQTGKLPKELEDLVELPNGCRRVWGWFWDLSNARGEGFNGNLPITYTEINSYFSLLKFEPLEWEVVLIKKFDIVYLNNQRSKIK